MLITKAKVWAIVFVALDEAGAGNKTLLNETLYGKTVWLRIFTETYGEAPISNEDPRWDPLFDPKVYAALMAARVYMEHLAQR